MLRTFVAALLVLVALTGTMIFGKQKPALPVAQVEEAPQTDRHVVYVGAWVAGFWENDTKTLNVDSLKTFEEQIGGKVALANIYADWKYLANPSLLTDLRTISQNGWTPIISSNPSFIDGCPNTGSNLYKTIADGSCDAFLESVGNNLKSYTGPVFFRFAWEMNLPSMYWSVPFLKSTPQDFIGAWQRFHTIVAKTGARNVIWVLSFNTSSKTTIPYAELYPGDAYVDWVAIDGYNWGTAKDWSKWTNFDGVFWKSYAELTKISDKPVMLSEVNSAPNGGDKAGWLRTMLEKIPSSYPNVQAIVFFNENKMIGESVDWRLERSSAYLDAVREGLSRDIYRRMYP